MGLGPSKLSAEELETLEAQVEDNCRTAADALRQADVLLLCTGAGFSADSGLAVYKDIAEVVAYQDLGLRYHDICRPEWLKHDPEMFYGFWGACYNDYRDTEPHTGYGLLRSWRDARFTSSRTARMMRDALRAAEATATEESANADCVSPGPVGSGNSPYAIKGHAGAFFLYTSNVDAHSYDFFEPCEVRECHGNTEVWQCGADTPCCKKTWRAPRRFSFDVETSTMRAPQAAWGSDRYSSAEANVNGEGNGRESICTARVGRVHKPFGRRKAPLSKLPLEEGEEVSRSFRKDKNWPICPYCGALARPAVLMFSDLQWINDVAQEWRWQAWKAAVADVAQTRQGFRQKLLKVLVLEIGCGANVPTVRHAAEGAALEFKDYADVTVVRINPDFPLPDRLYPPIAHLRHLALPMGGLEALQRISEQYQSLAKPSGGRKPPNGKDAAHRHEASRSRSRPRGADLD